MQATNDQYCKDCVHGIDDKGRPSEYECSQGTPRRFFGVWANSSQESVRGTDKCNFIPLTPKQKQEGQRKKNNLRPFKKAFRDDVLIFAIFPVGGGITGFYFNNLSVIIVGFIVWIAMIIASYLKRRMIYGYDIWDEL